MEKLKKVIFVDVDGTIHNSKYRLAHLYNTMLRPINKRKIIPENITTWDAGIHRDEVNYLFDSNVFYDKNYIFENTEESLLYAKEKGYYIIFYSIGTLKNLSNKTKFLAENFEGVSDGHLFYGTSIIKMGKKQFEPLMGDINILIDDHIDNLNNTWADYNVCAKMCGDNEEWNKDFTNKTLTLKSMSDIPKIIDFIEYDINIKNYGKEV